MNGKGIVMKKLILYTFILVILVSGCVSNEITTERQIAPVTHAPVIILPTPRNLSISETGANNVILNWNDAGTGISYNVYYSTLNFSSNAEFYGSSNQPFMEVIGLNIGTTYYFWVSSVLDGQEGNKSFSVSAKTLLMDMVWVPGGSFNYARDYYSNEFYNDTMDGFYIGKYPVTQEQFQAVMGYNPSFFAPENHEEFFIFEYIKAAMGYNSDFPIENIDKLFYYYIDHLFYFDPDIEINFWEYFEYEIGEDISIYDYIKPVHGEVQRRRPVENVSFYDAIIFCNRLSIIEGLTPAYSFNGSTNPDDWDFPIINYSEIFILSESNGYRLPTVNEWDYAAMGGEGSPGNFIFTYGSNDLDDVAWHVDNSDYRTHEVGKKAPNDLGIYDMSGNVWEFSIAMFGVVFYGEGQIRQFKYFIDNRSLFLRGWSWSIYFGYDEMYYDIGFRVVRP